MAATVFYDINDSRLYVRLRSGLTMPLRDFYIRQRIKSGITIGRLQIETGLNHPQLRNLEKRNHGGYLSDAPTPILAALETLGYKITISKETP